MRLRQFQGVRMRTVAAQVSHARRSRLGGKRSQIARRSVMSAARRMAFSSMPVSVVQLTASVTTTFRVRLRRYVT